jgi:hypothetical protein
MCNAEVEPWYMIVGRFFDRGRLAQSVLDEYLNRVGEPAADREIPDLDQAQRC